MRELEVGDVVKFRSDLTIGYHYGGLRLLDGMYHDVAGAIKKVQIVYNSGNFTVYGSEFFYSLEMLEPLFKNGETVLVGSQEFRYVGARRNGRHVVEENELHGDTYDSVATRDLRRPGDEKVLTIQEIADKFEIPISQLKIKK